MTKALISILAVLIMFNTLHANIIVNAQLYSTYELNNTLLAGHLLQIRKPIKLHYH
jgi:hypothetical protein